MKLLVTIAAYVLAQLIFLADTLRAAWRALKNGG